MNIDALSLLGVYLALGGLIATQLLTLRRLAPTEPDGLMPMAFAVLALLPGMLAFAFWPNLSMVLAAPVLVLSTSAGAALILTSVARLFGLVEPERLALAGAVAGAALYLLVSAFGQHAWLSLVVMLLLLGVASAAIVLCLKASVQQRGVGWWIMLLASAALILIALVWYVGTMNGEARHPIAQGWSHPLHVLLTLTGSVWVFAMAVAAVLVTAERSVVRPAGGMAHDSVTGLMTHSVFQEAFMRELERSRRTSEPLALAVCLIDQLAGLKAAGGQEALDRALKSLADKAKQVLRSTDLLGRLDKDRIALALPDSSSNDARKVMERLQAALSEESIAVGGLKQQVSVSIGITELLRKDGTLADVRNRAENGLNRALERGHGIVVNDCAEGASPIAPADQAKISVLLRLAWAAGTRS